ncbi:glycosyltransferase family 39 protein [Candidatus Dojkabacteria bacterium]|jgi:hypothetical protein|uniref:Glycosyltransferase family 39 protein n=1 Tax=Candidatus Dojkabacteria bacterium TaxID=2099670 RepID=A0A955KZP6_9BACT|nr:glycosyltransferase family 39 protein [Candidatus Dojkabacteria bacterium]
MTKHKISDIEKKFKSSKKVDLVFRSLVVLTFLFFILRTLELAISSYFGIGPDESYHIGLSKLYSENVLLVKNTEENIRYGLTENIPYLYHFILGNIIKLTSNNSIIDYRIILRIVNIVFATITVAYTYKITSLITKSRLVKLLSIVILTNLPMFSFLGAMVSYDNLLIMLSTISVYYLLVFTKSSNLKNLTLLIIFLTLGSLTKITILPLVLLLSIIALAQIYKNRHLIKIKGVTDLDITNLILIGIALFTSSLFLFHYGNNIISYKNILPNCTQVYAQEVCQRNKIFSRDEELTGNIPGVEIINRFHYFKYWKDHIYQTTTGIFGSKSLIKQEVLIVPYRIIVLITTIYLIRHFNRKSKSINYLILIVIFYSLFLAYYQNYRTYQNTQLIFVALQGRYILPIIGPIVSLISISLLNLSKNLYLKIIIFVMISTIFILGDYVYLKRNIPDSWYNKSQVSTFLKETNEIFR